MTSARKFWQILDLSRMLGGRSFPSLLGVGGEVTTARSCLFSPRAVRRCFQALSLRYRDCSLYWLIWRLLGEDPRIGVPGPTKGRYVVKMEFLKDQLDYLGWNK